MSGTVGGTSDSSYVSALNSANEFGGSTNIEDLIMAVQVERGNLLDKQIGDQMKDMEKRNQWLADANAALNAMRAARPADASSGTEDYNTTMFKKADGTQESVAQWAAENGVTLSTTNTQAGVDQSIANLKSSIDTVNSTSQMDMVRLQGLMDKRSQAFDMMSNTLQKTDKGLTDVIDKLGQ